MLSNLLEPAVIIAILAAGVRLATPYLFAALGETINQLAGVLNLGVEGIMLMSAFASYYVVVKTGSYSAAVLIAIFVGVLFGVLMAVATVTFNAQQGIAGIAIFLLGLGLSDLLNQSTLRGAARIRGIQAIHVPVLGDIPWLGQILFRQNPITYVAFACVPIAWFVINRTTFGMKVQAVGQNPAAADTVGINVTRIRYSALAIGGAMSGLAGASLSIALLNLFQYNMTSGIGFIAVALVYFGAWKPKGILIGALLFATINSLQLRIQTLGIDVPAEFALMLPYIVTIVVLALASRRNVREPAALTKPFTRSA